MAQEPCHLSLDSSELLRHLDPHKVGWGGRIEHLVTNELSVCLPQFVKTFKILLQRDDDSMFWPSNQDTWSDRGLLSWSVRTVKRQEDGIFAMGTNLENPGHLVTLHKRAISAVLGGDSQCPSLLSRTFSLLHIAWWQFQNSKTRRSRNGDSTCFIPNTFFPLGLASMAWP